MSSLITSCPSCNTRFKLVPDQLKVSDGWVRCGQCREIFDASSRIEQVTQAIVRPVPLLTEQWPDSVMPDPATALNTPPAQESLVAEPPPGGVLTPDAPPPQELDPEPEPTPEQPAATLTSTPVDIVVDQPGPDERIADLGFVRQDRLRALWQSTSMRLTLGTLTVMLTATLGLQILVHERDRLSSTQPSLAPLIQSVCDIWGCTVSSWRDQESIVIDGTQFQKLTTDSTSETYRVDMVIKNRHAHAVAWPALELTLTNNQDQVVARKVLDARQYARMDVLPGQSEHTLQTAIQVNTSQLAGRVSGYRVMLFYP